ncbi:MAG: glycosyltransferase [Acidobacteriota bacterium]
MARTQSPQLQPLHDLRQTGQNRWVAEGHDPQFLLAGPFRRGLWELRIRGTAPRASAHASMQLYHAAHGAFSEAASVSGRGLCGEEAERRLRFWLPATADSFRFDPANEPGPLAFESLQLRRLNLAAAVLRQWINLARADLRRALRWLWRIVSEPRRAKPMILQLAASTAVHDRYPEWLAKRCAVRTAQYAPPTPDDNLFSLLTTVYDTAPEYVDALAASVASQTFTGFEWIVLDNGSRNPRTLSAIASLAALAQVRLFRVDRNLGIIGGMRYVLERAGGRYILPVDSDDVLFPDTLAVVASQAQQHGYPALLYTDEDKLRDGVHTDPFLKPDWDPVLLRNCCYIAHLTAIDRAGALRLGAYTDASAEGCHDWDSFLRFARAGKHAKHVPDILYSWRMHAGSTAADVAAKDFIVASQRHVLVNHLARLGLDDRLEVVRSPHFPASPDWWIRRRRCAAPPASLLIDARAASPAAATAILARTGGYPIARIWLISTAEDAAAMTSAVRQAAPDVDLRSSSAGLPAALSDAVAADALLLALADASLFPVTDEWLWEMVGLKESYPDTVAVGGRILDASGRVVSGPLVFGYDGPVGSPDRGRATADAGYFGSALKQQSTSAVDGRLCGVDPGFLGALAAAGKPFPDSLVTLGPWLGLQALDQGRRVVFSPFIEASGEAPPAPLLDDYLQDTRYYHRLLSKSIPFEPDFTLLPSRGQAARFGTQGG